MCDLALRGCEIPASKGRRQVNHPQFQFGNKGLLCAPKIKKWPFASFQALNCRLRRKSDNWLWRRGRSNVISYRTTNSDRSK